MCPRPATLQLTLALMWYAFIVSEGYKMKQNFAINILILTGCKLITMVIFLSRMQEGGPTDFFSRHA